MVRDKFRSGATRLQETVVSASIKSVVVTGKTTFFLLGVIRSILYKIYKCLYKVCSNNLQYVALFACTALTVLMVFQITPYLVLVILACLMIAMASIGLLYEDYINGLFEAEIQDKMMRDAQYQLSVGIPDSPPISEEVDPSMVHLGVDPGSRAYNIEDRFVETFDRLGVRLKYIQVESSDQQSKYYFYTEGRVSIPRDAATILKNSIPLKSVPIIHTENNLLYVTIFH